MAGFVWQSPPSVVSGNLRSFQDKVLAALMQLGQTFAAILEAHARTNAPWSDRTGAARQGLIGFAASAATSVTIYLVHSVFYGIFLEMGTRKMGPRPIIGPTLEANYAAVMAALKRLLAGL